MWPLTLTSTQAMGDMLGMTDIRLLYVTTKDIDQARTIARALLEGGLVACANILPQMESLYLWQGKIETTQEAVLILKTKTSLVPRAMAAVQSHHTYETPCILSLSIEAGHQLYIDWLITSCTAHP